MSLRMQEMAFPGFKLKKKFGEYALTHVAFGHWYPPIILEQNWMLRIYAENGISRLQILKIFPQTPYSCVVCRPHMDFSHCYPPLIYYLTERSLFKKCRPPGRILKKGPGVGRITITGVFTTLQINNRLTEFWFLLNFDLSLNSLKHAISERISRAVTWGGGIFHIFMFTYRKINRFQMKSVGQNTNV
jgi:hypothetical protein